VKQTALVLSHAKLPGQGVEDCAQAPLPSHIPAAGVRVEPTQVWVPPQVWPPLALAQPPDPHWPVLPHASVLAQAASAPEVTGEQTPEASQAWHAPPHAEVQHTPSTQVRPLPQALLVEEQVWPAIQPAHLWVVVLQPMPLAQSLSAMHEVRHTVPLHVKSPQLVMAPPAQMPEPLQVAAVVCM
jgi:hypothetical protein